MDTSTLAITSSQQAEIIKLMHDKRMTYETVLDTAEDLLNRYSVVDITELSTTEADRLISYLKEKI